MDIEKRTLDELIAIMQRDGLDRLRIAVGDIDLDLRLSLPSAAAAQARSAADSQTGPASAGKPAKPSAPVAPENTVTVTAPLIGVFYRAPAPGAKPFVEVGDEVSTGQVLCILEAMKLMNEIVSEHNGKIARVCANDGQLVTLQQELFWIET